MGLHINTFACSIQHPVSAQWADGSICLYLEVSSEMLFRVRQPLLLLLELASIYRPAHVWADLTCLRSLLNKWTAAVDGCGDGSGYINYLLQDAWTSDPVRHASECTQASADKYFKEGGDAKLRHTVHRTRTQSCTLYLMWCSLLLWGAPGQLWDLWFILSRQSDWATQHLSNSCTVLASTQTCSSV